MNIPYLLITCLSIAIGVAVFPLVILFVALLPYLVIGGAALGLLLMIAAWFTNGPRGVRTNYWWQRGYEEPTHDQ
jgi:hypothetical protein